MKSPLERWWWIDFAVKADTADINEAKTAAGGSKRGILSKSLPFTEEDYRLPLLYSHIQKGQITPKAMRRLQRQYLDYIAGMDFPHPDLLKEDPEALTKLQGNVSRAKYELSKRNLIWATSFTAVIAFLGALAGGLLSR
jgi:hypothetical protein